MPLFCIFVKNESQRITYWQSENLNHQFSNNHKTSRNVSKLGDLIDRVMDLYDGLMQKALGIGWLRAYYSDPMVFVRHVAQKYMSGTTLTAEQEEQVAAEGFVPLLGKEEVQRIAKKLTRKHAWHVGIMTFLCSLPQNWVMWPLFVVDIVYFQKEVFLLTQEMEILFGKTRTKRDYTSLAAVAVKMGGTQMKQKAVGWVKRGAGKGMRMALEYGSKVFRGSLQVLVRQALKWIGVVGARDLIDVAIDMVVYICTSFIAGMVSYWLFIPMGNRLLRDLMAEDGEVKEVLCEEGIGVGNGR